MIDTGPLLALIAPLYRDHPGWAAERGAIVQAIAAAAAARPAGLAALDKARAARPAWFGAAGMIGYSCYVDRFAGTIAGVRARLGWLDALGVRMLHTLPITRAQPGDSDGGFAVADYRAVDPALGTVADVRALAADLHARGMALTLDCVLNHTARDHAWAQAARAGDAAYRSYFHIIKGLGEVAAWESTLDEVFPDTAPGNFTYDPAIGGWVWTSFYPFQWDLDWSNPAVFREMLDILLFWANVGVDAFRLDSAPYLWKRRGTPCRNLPETHRIVEALRAGLDLVAPGVALLAEAIERTSEVMPYLEPADGARACQLAYHNGAMAATWVALATGDAGTLGRLVTDTVLARPDTAWLTYLRAHDDIIWSALNDLLPDAMLDAASRFFTAGAGGYSQGHRFQSRAGAAPSTVGMLATLVGGDTPAAVARYRLLLGTLLALPGMPMLYMGDEIGLPDDPAAAAAADARWRHRPAMGWARAEAADAGDGAGAAFLAVTRKLAALRAGHTAFDAKARAIVHPADPALLVLERGAGAEALLAVANYGPAPLSLPAIPGWGGTLHDLLGGDAAAPIPAGAVRWLVRTA